MYFYLLAFQLKKVLKKWKNPNVGWENGHREMKVLQETRGKTKSPKLKTGEIVLKKAMYKTGNPAR